MKHRCLRYSSGKIQRNGNLTEKSPGINAACCATPASVDRDFQTQFLDEYTFSGESVEIGFTEMKSSGDRLNL